MPFLKLRMPSPIPLPSSGMREAPKSTTRMTRMSTISPTPRPNICDLQEPPSYPTPSLGKGVVEATAPVSFLVDQRVPVAGRPDGGAHRVRDRPVLEANELRGCHLHPADV